MNDNQRFVLQDTLKKIVDDEVKTGRAEMKERLLRNFEESGSDRIRVDIGDMKAHVTLCDGRRTLKGEGPDFLEFMDAQGMTCLQVDPDWKDHVEIVGNSVVWRETGEVVPGAWVEEGASYPKVSGIKATERVKVLEEARRAGLIGGELPLLEV